MEALHNAAEKTKEFAHNVAEKITGNGPVTDNDIAKAIEHVEHLKHKKFEHDIEADMRIAKAAKEIDDERHKLHLKNMEAEKKIARETEGVLKEQRKRQAIDTAAAHKMYDTAAQDQRLHGDPIILMGAPVVTYTKEIHKTVEHQFELQQDQFKQDVKAEKKIISAAEDVEAEVYKQKMENLDASKELEEANEKYQREMQKKMEMDFAEDAKIKEAADQLEQLKARQMQERCGAAANARGHGESHMAQAARTEIH